MGVPWTECLLCCVVVMHVLVCPYTKVEESFNIQAIHDILHYSTNISQYDHLQYPGVVPRTFLGPLVVAISSSPVIGAMWLMNAPKIFEQIVVRLCLGNAVLVGLLMYADAVKSVFGRQTSRFMLIITASQFHFLFYSSRTLPNIFALVLVLFAVRSWLKQLHRSFIWLSGAAILIFRAELSLFLGILLLLDLIRQRVSIIYVIKTALPAAIVLLALTVTVDSYFWQRWLWPEGEVLWYNTILNKSSNWGTLPFLWYFYSALPRALSFSIFLVPVGLCLSPRLMQLVLPALTFVFLYSFLPHKELRFIIYVIPVCNTAVAEALHKLWINRNKSVLRKLLAFGALLHICGNILTSGIFLYTSYQNYPGGEALRRFHEIEAPTSAIHVHIDVAAAQTGITRFGQLYPDWIYNKTEDLVPGGSEMMSYSHLIIGNSTNLKYYENSHIVIDTVEGFDGLHIDRNKLPFFFWKHKPKIWILKTI
ncbi:probable Dol-P-Man:Man(7)GlcNAc(2)-PP-Dol alpha-1,6-mannosyltransferase [Ruditapes philippinarum]|uniref:probable Dol-P-Man:Man(7)GlcNAc(2)-PP-Dol alpha-1,6-mannosyltransferase n=1 Tax=Ruditapes philippinarum TaxID=129788 RepID=UPI00295A83B6|nr:probable Dol-P-Man:Man(7)GlcNAc(2)-PP-Dol alpha-1,6-mannosyltransferase [Ruditapes philippinarum]